MNNTVLPSQHLVASPILKDEIKSRLAAKIEPMLRHFAELFTPPAFAPTADLMITGLIGNIMQQINAAAEELLTQRVPAPPHVATLPFPAADVTELGNIDDDRDFLPNIPGVALSDNEQGLSTTSSFRSETIFSSVTKRLDEIDYFINRPNWLTALTKIGFITRAQLCRNLAQRGFYRNPSAASNALGWQIKHERETGKMFPLASINQHIETIIHEGFAQQSIILQSERPSPDPLAADNTLTPDLVTASDASAFLVQPREENETDLTLRSHSDKTPERSIPAFIRAEQSVGAAIVYANLPSDDFSTPANTVEGLQPKSYQSGISEQQEAKKNPMIADKSAQLGQIDYFTKRPELLRDLEALQIVTTSELYQKLFEYGFYESKDKASDTLTSYIRNERKTGKSWEKALILQRIKTIVRQELAKLEQSIVTEVQPLQEQSYAGHLEPTTNIDSAAVITASTGDVNLANPASTESVISSLKPKRGKKRQIADSASGALTKSGTRTSSASVNSSFLLDEIDYFIRRPDWIRDLKRIGILSRARLAEILCESGFYQSKVQALDILGWYIRRERNTGKRFDKTLINQRIETIILERLSEHPIRVEEGSETLSERDCEEAPASIVDPNSSDPIATKEPLSLEAAPEETEASVMTRDTFTPAHGPDAPVSPEKLQTVIHVPDAHTIFDGASINNEGANVRAIDADHEPLIPNSSNVLESGEFPITEVEPVSTTDKTSSRDELSDNTDRGASLLSASEIDPSAVLQSIPVSSTATRDLSIAHTDSSSDWRGARKSITSTSKANAATDKLTTKADVIARAMARNIAARAAVFGTSASEVTAPDEEKSKQNKRFYFKAPTAFSELLVEFSANAWRPSDNGAERQRTVDPDEFREALSSRDFGVPGPHNNQAIDYCVGLYRGTINPLNATGHITHQAWILVTLLKIPTAHLEVIFPDLKDRIILVDAVRGIGIKSDTYSHAAQRRAKLMRKCKLFMMNDLEGLIGRRLPDDQSLNLVQKLKNMNPTTLIIPENRWIVDLLEKAFTTYDLRTSSRPGSAQSNVRSAAPANE